MRPTATSESARGRRCWRRAPGPTSPPLQFALAGLNAHVNHDVPVGLVPACAHAGIAPSLESPQYRDDMRVTALLGATEERVKAWLLTGAGGAAPTRGTTRAPPGRWAHLLREGDAATCPLPCGRLLVLRLGDLVAHERTRSYERLLDFLAIDDEPAMHALFDAELTAERANFGRWRRDLTPRRQLVETARYARKRAGLRRDRVSGAPPLRDLVPRPARPARREDLDPPTVAIDPWTRR